MPVCRPWTHMWEWSLNPLIIILRSRLRWVISFTLRPFYTEEFTSLWLLNKRFSLSIGDLGNLENWKTFNPLRNRITIHPFFSRYRSYLSTTENKKQAKPTVCLRGKYFETCCGDKMRKRNYKIRYLRFLHQLSWRIVSEMWRHSLKKCTVVTEEPVSFMWRVSDLRHIIP